jgi:hypothetical protein
MRAGHVFEVGLRPAVESAVHLLELASDWSQELMDPDAVVEKAAKHGHAVNDIADLRKLDLKDCDALLARTALVWRTVGAVEGAAIGALALIPVAGGVVAITADFVVIHVMSTAIATRVAYSYGFDARHPEEQEFIEKIVTRSFLAQGGKAATLRDANSAAKVLKGRQRWSQKLRDDEKLVAALEKFMKRFYTGGKMPVKDVGKAIPVVSILVGSGMNSHLLGQVTQDAKRFCQTRFLCEKYGLPMPEAINHLRGDEGEVPSLTSQGHRPFG